MTVYLQHRQKLVERMHSLQSEVMTLEKKKAAEQMMQPSVKPSPAKTHTAPVQKRSTPPKSTSPRAKANKASAKKTEEAENLDARIKSIIANALMAEDQAKSVQGENKTTKSAHRNADSNRQQNQKQQPVMESVNSGKAMQHVQSPKEVMHPGHNNADKYNRMSPKNGSLVDYTQISPAKLALKKHLSQEKLQVDGELTGVDPQTYGVDGCHGKAQHGSSHKGSVTALHSKDHVINNHVPLGSNGIISLPVSIPLKNVGDVIQKSMTSLPISIPLASVHGDSIHTHTDARDTSSSKLSARDRSLSPLSRDVYSPISSSSSTASACSVRNFGSQGSSASPRSNNSSAFNVENFVAENGQSPASSKSSQFVSSNVHMKEAPGSMPFSHNPMMLPGKLAPGAPPVGIFPGCPQMGTMLGISMASPNSHNYRVPKLTSQQKDLYDAFLKSSSSHKEMASPHNFNVPFTMPSNPLSVVHAENGLNGISKNVQGQLDKSSKKLKRKRTKSDEVSSKKKHGEKKSKESANTPDIVSMLSNASQPLAITAISDAESSTKSSPGQISPSKLSAAKTLEGIPYNGNMFMIVYFEYCWYW